MYCEVQGCCNSKGKKDDPSSSAAPQEKYRFFRIPQQTVLKLNLTCDQEDDSSGFAVVCNLHFKTYKLPPQSLTAKVHIKTEPGASTSIPTIKTQPPKPS